MTERVILESEVFMTDTKKNTLTILAVVLTMGLSFWTSMKLSPPCPSLRLIVRATPTD